ncbi:hypothetical protein [Oceanobacillus massiliensis]|uniref:hypothetical protein n=1 Tax=Oceanobacillus massiliensis TaxID=1465765 RepID=UPI0002882CB8|nr:hypothetical protein [Oceanobacillus massiliensis]
MSRDKMEQQMEQILKKQTEEAMNLKDGTWNKINQELFSSTAELKVKAARKVKRKGRVFAIAGLSTVAIITILFFGMMTDQGQAMIQNLKDMFVEEKQEEIELEGHKEDTNVQLETNEELRYIIYIDEDRYKMVEGDLVDRIETIEPLGERYPEVYMEITRMDDTTTKEVEAVIKDAIEADPKMELHREESVTVPIEAEMIQAMGSGYSSDGGQWDTPIHRYYVTDEDEGQVFVIKQVYFLEAAEGHGARFSYMLESFKVVK